jgi:hypothetical protein
VTGQRITVRQAHGRVALRLRLDPPGRIVVEQLDMRFGSGHVLATEHTWAVGRYLQEDSDLIDWAHVPFLRILGGSSLSAAIEFLDPDAMAVRADLSQADGLTTPGGAFQFRSDGLIFKRLGIVIASATGGFGTTGFGMNTRRLPGMRNAIRDPETFRFHVFSSDPE